MKNFATIILLNIFGGDVLSVNSSVKELLEEAVKVG